MGKMKKKESVAKQVVGSIISDIKSSRLLVILKSSFKSWYSNWPWLILSVLFDLLFLIAAASSVTVIQFALFDHLDALMQMSGEATGGLMNAMNDTAGVSSKLMGLTATEEFNYHINAVVKYLGIMVLCTFIIWAIFQCLSWYAAYRISTEKKDRQRFLIFWKNFALESIPFYLLTVFWIFISVKMVISAKMSVAPVIGEGIINFLFVLFVIATWYFGALCYTITTRYSYSNFKQSFLYGTKRFWSILQSVFAIIVLFLIIHLFFKIGFIRNDQFITIVLGIAIFLPALCFVRVFLFKTRQEHWKGKEEKAHQKINA